MRLAVSDIITETMSRLNIDYPKLDEEHIKNLEKYKKSLSEEELK